MIFNGTKLAGVFEIGIDPNTDERGFFARTWCEREFKLHGLNPRLAQCNVSYNEKKGTLRGLHYQASPHPEAKLVRCTKGTIFDVVVDLRRQSQTYKKWVGVRLESEKHNMVYVPEGCAHGFLSLEEKTEVFYQMSEFYYPELSRGVRWNDPVFNIEWPAEVQIISERDRSYPDFVEA
jgi:dTDP-4-dehydrorhamnose 3,5-epimerase